MRIQELWWWRPKKYKIPYSPSNVQAYRSKVSYLNLLSKFCAEDSTEKENVLGLDFLSRFVVTLDLSAKQLYLEPDPNYKDDALKWISTGYDAVPTSDGKITVSGLYAPSPASEAGLKIGDEILEVNGKLVDNASYQTIYSTIKHVAGTIVRLKIRRKGEDKPREFTLKMRKLI